MKFVSVEWLDVFKMTSDDYFENEVDVDKRLVKFQTIGWVFQESEKTLMLVQEFGGGKPHDWIVIPKCLIQKTVVICDA